MQVTKIWKLKSNHPNSYIIVLPHQSGVRGALGAAATGTAGEAPRRGTDSAKAGNRGAKGAGVTG